LFQTSSASGVPYPRLMAYDGARFARCTEHSRLYTFCQYLYENKHPPNEVRRFTRRERCEVERSETSKANGERSDP